MSQVGAPVGQETALVPSLDRDSSWHPILHASNQVVLYNPTSHALIIHNSSQTATSPPAVPRLCPYCSQPLPGNHHEQGDEVHVQDEDAAYANLERFEDVLEARAADYFQLLEVAHETASRPPSPPLPSAQSLPSSRTSSRTPSPIGGSSESAFRPESMAEGYFKAFFQEEARLGMGANGSVFLCQHVLNGNPLGRFAVKKIAVGQSASYLLKILREVHLLETLRHPNIITYHHAWLETAQFSSFGPRIPTLHVLMQWAEGGSLDDYIDARLGRPTHPPQPDSQHPDDHDDESTPDIHSRSARIRAFRAMQRAAPEEKSALRTKLGNNGQAWTAVHLLSAEEVLGIFGGVAAGLGFLHDKSILHLDLKPGNVLLTWDEGTLIPRAMLSDFGTSRDMLQTPRARTGNTGTLEYSSPESIPIPPHNLLPPTDSKSDMWSLGMILHKLLFFRLPYRWAAYGDRLGLDGSSNTAHQEDDRGNNDMDRLEREVSAYPGFKSSARLETLFASRRLPRSYLVLLESLLNVSPPVRPSCEKVLAALHLGKFDPVLSKSIVSDVLASRPGRAPDDSASKSSLIPAPRRSASSSHPSPPSVPQLAPPTTSGAGHSSPPTGPPGEKKRLPAPSQPRWLDWIPIDQLSRVFKSSAFAFKVASLCFDGKPLPSWLLTMLVGLAIRDSLSDSIFMGVWSGVVHVVVLKGYVWWVCAK